MSADPHRRKLLSLIGASAAVATLPDHAIGGAPVVDARVFAPAVDAAVPLELAVPGRFTPLISQLAASLDASYETVAADFDAFERYRTRLILVDEVAPYPPTPPASPGPDA